MSDREYEIIWLAEERIFAELVQLGAHFSSVRYSRGGIDYEELIDNDEFYYLEQEEDSGDDTTD